MTSLPASMNAAVFQEMHIDFDDIEPSK